MAKTACILISHLPVQVERRRNPDLNNHPLVVGGRPWDAGAVLDCCPLAEATSVRAGMRLSRAEALCPSARFLPAEPEVLRRLTWLDIVTLGAFAALPRLAVIRQFGPQAGFLHNLASGSDPRPVHADAPPSKELVKLPNGVPVRVGGMIVSRQRPPTAKGTGFLAIEDEQGLVNVVLPPDIYEDDRRAFGSIFVVVEGRLQRQGKAVSVLAQRVVPLESAA